VIVVFVVTNAMAMAIIERTREIGTLRAHGHAAHPSCCVAWGWRGCCWAAWARWPALCWRWVCRVLLLVVPMNMPPPPGRSVGYPLNVVHRPHAVPGSRILAMVSLTLIASATPSPAKPSTCRW
jgi:putative ABC transport system permease protein